MIGQWPQLMYEERQLEQSRMSIIDTITLGTTPKNQHDFILIDRSGSMAGKWDDTIGGVNAYVRKLAADPATRNILVTVALFDHHENETKFEVVRRSCAANHWEDLSSLEFSPRGWTPLYDAVGKLVTLALEDNPEKSAIVIVTDGMENKSREHNRETAKALLDLCRKREWQVLFLGADFENSKQASDLGNSRRHTSSYDTRKSHDFYETMGSTRSLYSKGLADMSFEPKKDAGSK